MSCFSKDCTSQAEWTPKIRVWARGHDKKSTPAAELEPSLGLCDTCRQKFNSDDLLTEDFKESLIDGFRNRGLVEPDFSTAEVTFHRCYDFLDSNELH